MDKLNVKFLKKYTKKQLEYKEQDDKTVERDQKLKARAASAKETLLQDAEKQKPPIEKVLEECNYKINDLIYFGTELVSNIKVANEKREIIRRNYEAFRKENLLADLEKESIEAMARYTEIMEKWTELEEIKEPMGLYEQLEGQKGRIQDLMQQKDDVIKQCQEEIRRVDERYYVDQDKQDLDISSLVERIDSETELIRKTFFDHVKLLEETIEDERKNINLTAKRRWDENYELMVSMEEKKLEFRKDRQKFYEEEIERITTEQEDITRATRIRLERDAENLQLELRNTKNNILMNCEKLDYNYQILQKKNEENTIINNQQKRRVAKINENIATLKKKIAETKTSSEHTIKKLSEEVMRLHNKITDLENKTEHFQINSLKKYEQVWEINYNEAMEYLTKILDIDKIIYEQHLGLPWTRPDIPLLRRRTTFSKTKIDEKKAILPKISDTSQDETRFLRNILRKISEKSLFLIESKLVKIMEAEPMSDVQKCLVRIDNIFQALRITNIEDVNSLIEYFKPYSWCPTCSKGVEQNMIAKLFSFDTENDTVAIDTLPSSSDSIYEASLEKTDPTNVALEDESSSEVVQFSDLDEDVNKMLTGNQRESAAELTDGYKSESQKRRVKKEKVCPNHFLVIEPALVLTALREFTERHLYKNAITSETNIVRSKSSKEGGSKSTNKKDVKKFWGEFLNVFPEEKQNLWKGLEHGLNHFMDVLKQRELLDRECEFLRQQNKELKHLLQGYL